MIRVPGVAHVAHNPLKNGETVWQADARRLSALRSDGWGSAASARCGGPGVHHGPWLVVWRDDEGVPRRRLARTPSDVGAALEDAPNARVLVVAGLGPRRGR